MLEIGFGRGYSTFCAVKAFKDFGIDGKITTIDPNFDQNFLIKSEEENEQKERQMMMAEEQFERARLKKEKEL